jgi:hypothetical protein
MSNHTEIIDYLKYCKNYILGLKLNGVPVVQTNRKTGFLGFLVDIESLMSMFTKYRLCIKECGIAEGSGI